MNREKLEDLYFEWICTLVMNESDRIAYRKLLIALHTKIFTYTMPLDENRLYDAIELRHRFVDILNPITGPALDLTSEWLEQSVSCSVLEMMTALALRCEETIMTDNDIGDRTSLWFTTMINNLGLTSMTNERFDRTKVDYILDRFLNREYEPNGIGGLFVLKRHPNDLREVEIWYQAMWYLAELPD